MHDRSSKEGIGLGASHGRPLGQERSHGQDVPQHAFAAEPLERRTLLSWGAIPQLIDQDLAVSRYPQANGAGQVIADIDTGINAAHPALAGRIFRNAGEIPGNGKDDDGNGTVDDVSGWDFVNRDNVPDDRQGHGTMTAGIMVANRFVNTGNTRGYRGDGKEYQGVAAGATVLPLKVAEGTSVNVYHVEQALQYVIANRARFNITAVNMSLGFSSSQLRVIADEISTLTRAGVFISFGGTSDTALVSQVTPSGAFTPRSWRSSDTDMLAPGDQVPYLDQGRSYGIGGDASSYATPYIAAAGAVLKQINPRFSSAQVLSILQQSGRNVGGYKLLDLDDAIALAYKQSGQPTSTTTPKPVPPPPTPAPTPAPAPAPAVPQGSTRSAFAVIQAESADANSGANLSGGIAGSLDQGDVLTYKRVDFGSSGATKAIFKLAVPATHAGKVIDIRVGGPAGRVIGSLVVRPTGSWGAMQIQEAHLAKVTGLQDVSLTFRGGGGVANVDWFKFA